MTENVKPDRVLVTRGGRFGAHHFLRDDVPKEIHIYLGLVRVLGTPEGTWLIYRRETSQRFDNPKQVYYYDKAFIHHPVERPRRIDELVRYY